MKNPHGQELSKRVSDMGEPLSPAEWEVLLHEVMYNPSGLVAKAVLLTASQRMEMAIAVLHLIDDSVAEA